MSRNKSWRSSVAVRTCLVAALAASSGMIGYEWAGGQEPELAPSSPTHASTQKSALAAAPFTTADTGSCLTWDINPDGSFANFGQTDCASEHRFEVSSRENLAAYPSSEFGPNAPAPDLTRQAQLREELCKGPTTEYLGGRFDPLGRYSIAPILPPREAWAAGDRTMLCGVQVSDTNGVPTITKGKVNDQDQSRVSQAGECIAIDASGASRTVDCGTDHQFEVTKVINLEEVFPDKVPTVEEQDGYLQKQCTQAALDYLGGDDALYNSTLQAFWSTVPTNSWIGGSHTVNCSLFKASRDGKLSTLKGSAKGAFTIDGAAPPPQPTRNPLRKP
ncbi:septum formation family protein [Corynebacterium epidermidicanis]|uniref:Septum formation n=1 Tax=Corynebacterium epidermidicanis TaxID=1050174 RepID=A0A0G3GXD7_9CORY|nr:septum formation family protein [Corynebacterium epidermidicanis]AKK04173.1 Septum formation [Corynebacterium epidermidicanis]